MCVSLNPSFNTHVKKKVEGLIRLFKGFDGVQRVLQVTVALLTWFNKSSLGPCQSDPTLALSLALHPLTHLLIHVVVSALTNPLLPSDSLDALSRFDV